MWDTLFVLKGGGLLYFLTAQVFPSETLVLAFIVFLDQICMFTRVVFNAQ